MTRQTLCLVVPAAMAAALAVAAGRAGAWPVGWACGGTTTRSNDE